MYIMDKKMNDYVGCISNFNDTYKISKKII